VVRAGLAVLAAALIGWWLQPGRQWRDMHSFGLSAGAIATSLLTGFNLAPAQGRINVIGHEVIALGTVVLLAFLA